MHRDKVIAKSAPLCYVVCADNKHCPQLILLATFVISQLQTTFVTYIVDSTRDYAAIIVSSSVIPSVRLVCHCQQPARYLQRRGVGTGPPDPRTAGPI